MKLFPKSFPAGLRLFYLPHCLRQTPHFCPDNNTNPWRFCKFPNPANRSTRTSAG